MCACVCVCVFWICARREPTLTLFPTPKVYAIISLIRPCCLCVCACVLLYVCAMSEPRDETIELSQSCAFMCACMCMCMCVGEPCHNRIDSICDRVCVSLASRTLT